MGDVDGAIESVNLEEGWFDTLLTVEPDVLALIMGELANLAKVRMSQIKRARTGLESFSKAKWVTFAEHFGLPSDAAQLQLGHFPTPTYRLPLSFHEAVFETAWRAQDVFQERVKQNREAARVRILDPVSL
jgi:hypothetical protein